MCEFGYMSQSKKPLSYCMYIIPSFPIAFQIKEFANHYMPSPYLAQLHGDFTGKWIVVL